MAIPFFGIGNASDCRYSYLCCPCALAQSRSNLDGSSFLFNLFCSCALPNRWLIRTAYGIEGRPFDDLISAICFPCCSVNQLYQTSKRNGNPTSNGGRPYNTDVFRGDLRQNFLFNCLLSTFCTPCSRGWVLQQSIGMPFWMGCCCVDTYEARNIVRYQYRIAGEDNYELIAPCGLQIIDRLITQPSLGYITFYKFAEILVIIQLLAEIENRKNDDNTGGRYLTGYREIPIDLEEEEEYVQYEDVVGRNLEIASNRST